MKHFFGCSSVWMTNVFSAKWSRQVGIFTLVLLLAAVSIQPARAAGAHPIHALQADTETPTPTLTLTPTLTPTPTATLDTTAPYVTGVSASTADGTYGASTWIYILVAFNERVNIVTSPPSPTGTPPQLILETGGTNRKATYYGPSSVNPLKYIFRYQVQPGDFSPDLDYINTGALILNDGTIRDAAGNDASRTLATPGAPNSLGNNADIIIKTARPFVLDVTSNNADTTYKAGANIDIKVKFSEKVKVDTSNGTPQLTLETGANDALVDYTSGGGGGGSDTLTFRYTVGPGENSLDLDYTSIALLKLNGGTIQDTAGNDAFLMLPVPGNENSLGANKNFVIDTTAPTIIGVSSTLTNGSYGEGVVIPITITFTEPIAVTGGAPKLTLETGTQPKRQVNCVIGSDTRTLICDYLVNAGENSSAPALNYASQSALSGTIRDEVGNNNTNPTLPALTSPQSLVGSGLVIDTSAPTVVSFTRQTPSGQFTNANELTFLVTFSEPMGYNSGLVDASDFMVNGDSSGTTITVIDSSPNTSFAVKVSGGDLANLTGDVGLDFSNTMNIEDRAGNQLAAGEPTPPNDQIYTLDNIAPTVANVTSTNANGGYPIGAILAITIQFDESVNVTGAPQLTLETGATDAVAVYASGSGSTTLTFNYTVAAGQASADLDYTGASALNGGSIRDNAGNDATLTLPGIGATGSLGVNKAIVIDTTPPIVTDVSSTKPDGTYGTGVSISITVTFSETVTVTGAPQLTLETGATDQAVSYTGGSGTNTLTFNYTTQHGDTSSDLDYVSGNSLSLNGGTIRDAANNAILTLPSPAATGSLGANKAIDVDATEPIVINVTSAKPDGSYRAGEIIDITVEFNEVVTVTGAPQLTLETGATDRAVNYASGDGTTTLTFSYTVLPGDTSSDLDYTGASALMLNGGSIKDGSSNAAILTLPTPAAPNSLGVNKAIVIDTTKPIVKNVTSAKPNSSYKAGAIIDITVEFKEVVNVTGAPQLTLETGATDQTVNYASGTGTATLTFNYTVQSGDNSLDLDYTSTGSLALNGGSIKDQAGNDANLTLAAPGVLNSLGANKALVIDTTPPAAPAISAPADVSFTNDTTPTVTGTAEANSTITIFIGGVQDGATTPTDGSGNWSHPASSTLGVGAHTVKATAIDAAGNVSNDSNTNTFTVDTTDPTAKIEKGPLQISRVSTFEFSANEPAIFMCKVDTGGQFVKCDPNQSPATSATVTLSGLANGDHTLQIQAEDRAGNPSAVVPVPAYAWNLQKPPDVSTDSHPSNPSFVDGQKFKFTNKDPKVTFTCAVDAGDSAACVSPAYFFGLSYGPHTSWIRAVDDQGAGIPDSYTWVINDTNLVSTPAKVTRATSATFTFTSAYPDADMHFECVLDQSTTNKFGDCTPSKSWKGTGLSYGTHVFKVRAKKQGVDSTGNSAMIYDTTPAEYTWTILQPKERTVNGGFNTYPGTSKIPTGWVKSATFTALDGKDISVKKEGTASVKITGNGKTKTLTQTLNLAGLGGAQIDFSFYAHRVALPAGGVCNAQVILYRADGLISTKTVLCPTGTYAFTKKTISFSAPWAFNKVVIKFTFNSKPSGAVWFDQVSLIE